MVLPPSTTISPEAIAITGFNKPDNAILKLSSEVLTVMSQGVSILDEIDATWFRIVIVLVKPDENKKQTWVFWSITLLGFNLTDKIFNIVSIEISFTPSYVLFASG